MPARGECIESIAREGKIRYCSDTYFITLAVMIVIFVHSAMPGDISGCESSFFAEILSLITGLRFQTAHFVVRKAAHFTIFTILGICLTVNFNDFKAKQLLMRHPLLTAWIAGTLYAGTDEFHQFFIEGRSCEFRDVCIDATGVAFGIAITAIVRNVKSGYTVK